MSSTARANSRTSTTVLSAADIKAIAREVHALMSAPVPTDAPAVTAKKAPAKKGARKAPAKKAAAKRTTAKRTAAKKAAPKKAAPKKAPTGRSHQDVQTLGRKGWNRALTALAKAAGSTPEGSVYALVTEPTVWGSIVKEARDGGLTPAQTLELVRAL